MNHRARGSLSKLSQRLPLKRYAEPLLVQHIFQVGNLLIFAGQILLKLIEFQLDMSKFFCDAFYVLSQSLRPLLHLLNIQPLFVGIMLVLFVGFEVNVEEHFVDAVDHGATLRAILRPFLPLQQAHFVEHMSAERTVSLITVMAS